MSHQIDEDSIVIKIIVLGSAGVGKTALMERYCGDIFSDKRNPTIGTDFRTKILEIHDTEVVLQVWDTAGQERFHHSTLGSAFYRNSHGAMLVYDVMNPRSIQQLAQWRDEAVSKIDADVYFPIVVVGNKLDLKTLSSKVSSPTNSGRERRNSNPFEKVVDDSDESVTWTEAYLPGNKKSLVNESLLFGDQEELGCKDSQQTVLQWCRNNSYGHLETSAKEGVGIQAAMQTIAALSLEAYKTNPKNIKSSKKNRSNGKEINLDELYAPKRKGTCDTCSS